MAEKDSEKAPGAFSLLGTASTMGLHMVSGPIVGGGLGWLIDQGLDSWPVASAIGILLGLVAGFRNVWADAQYLERSNAARDAERKKQEDAGRKSIENEKKVKEKAKKSELVLAVHKGDRAVSGGTSSVNAVQCSEGKEREEDAFTASVLAGTAVSAEQGLEELDETLEAIRNALKAEGDENTACERNAAQEKGVV